MIFPKYHDITPMRDEESKLSQNLELVNVPDRSRVSLLERRRTRSLETYVEESPFIMSFDPTSV